MKDEYLIWKQLEDTWSKAIENSKTDIMINSELLKLAQAKLSKLPKPKIKENKPVGTG